MGSSSFPSKKNTWNHHLASSFKLWNHHRSRIIFLWHLATLTASKDEAKALGAVIEIMASRGATSEVKATVKCP